MKARFFLMLICAMAIVVNSCQKEDEDPDDVRSKYTGDWNVTENNTHNYNVNIELDPSNSSQVLINYFYNTSNGVVYAIATSSSLTIPEQKIQNATSFTVSGTGTLVANNKINWRYSVNDGADLKQIVAVYTK